MKKISINLYNACEYANENSQISKTKIGEMFEVDRHSISQHLKDYLNYSILFNDEYYYLSEEELKPVLFWLDNHKRYSLREISKKFSVKPDTIKRRLEVLGENYTAYRRKIFNQSAFKSIVNEGQAYWLGFILADGYLDIDRGCLRIKLAQKDENHLLKFINFMNGENIEIKHDIGGAYAHNNVCSYITFNSRLLTNDLFNQHIEQNKSGKEKPVKMPNLELTLAYIRGMIDGDGHVEDGYFKYVGSKESCEYVKNIFSQWYNFNPNNKYIYKHGKIFSFEVRSKQINKILHLIYDNATIYLDRKYKIVQNIK